MNLQEFFAENPRVAIAFSGGVDSSYLLYAALHYGARARAYYVNSAFQPAFELEDARRLAGELNADMKVLPVDVLASETVTANPPDRCYHCKQMIFRTILAAAEADGFTVLLDGTNASDDAGDRPGSNSRYRSSVRLVSLASCRALAFFIDLLLQMSAGFGQIGANAVGLDRKDLRNFRIRLFIPVFQFKKQPFLFVQRLQRGLQSFDFSFSNEAGIHFFAVRL